MSMPPVFAFVLGEEVAIGCSGERGFVIGRWQSVNCCNRYLVRYKNALGTACECWWDEDALTIPPDRQR